MLSLVIIDCSGLNLLETISSVVFIFVAKGATLGIHQILDLAVGSEI